MEWATKFEERADEQTKAAVANAQTIARATASESTNLMHLLLSVLEQYSQINDIFRHHGADARTVRRRLPHGDELPHDEPAPLDVDIRYCLEHVAENHDAVGVNELVLSILQTYPDDAPVIPLGEIQTAVASLALDNSTSTEPPSFPLPLPGSSKDDHIWPDEVDDDDILDTVAESHPPVLQSPQPVMTEPFAPEPSASEPIVSSSASPQPKSTATPMPDPFAEKHESSASDTLADYGLQLWEGGLTVVDDGPQTIIYRDGSVIWRGVLPVGLLDSLNIPHLRISLPHT